MLDHVSITVADFAAAERFYDAVFAALGIPKVGSDASWAGYGLRADAGHPHRLQSVQFQQKRLIGTRRQNGRTITRVEG